MKSAESGFMDPPREDISLPRRPAGAAWGKGNSPLAVSGSALVRADAFYNSRYDKWSRTELAAGSTFPISGYFELEGYYKRQNDSAGSLNWWLNAVGVVINLYF
jgi:hypothetical protein